MSVRFLMKWSNQTGGHSIIMNIQWQSVFTIYVSWFVIKEMPFSLSSLRTGLWWIRVSQQCQAQPGCPHWVGYETHKLSLQNMKFLSHHTPPAPAALLSQDEHFYNSASASDSWWAKVKRSCVCGDVSVFDWWLGANYVECLPNNYLN